MLQGKARCNGLHINLIKQANIRADVCHCLAKGAGEDEEADPLDAFMAEISAEVREDKPVAAKPAADLALDDDDNVADFLEVPAARDIMLLCPALIWGFT